MTGQGPDDSAGPPGRSGSRSPAAPAPRPRPGAGRAPAPARAGCPRAGRPGPATAAHGPWLSRSDCTRACGTRWVRRVSQPSRPDHQPRRRADGHEPPPRPEPPSGPGQAAAASACSRAGQPARRSGGRPASRRAPADATGITVEEAGPCRSSPRPPPARDDVERAQPSRRHSSGSVIEMPCTRGSAIVCASSSNSPRRTCRPAGRLGDGEAVVAPDSLRNAASPAPIEHREQPADGCQAAEPRRPARTAGPRPASDDTVSGDSSRLSGQQPEVQPWSSSRSGACGRRRRSPCSGCALAGSHRVPAREQRLRAPGPRSA